MLFFVATPIGNLGDLTERVRETLSRVDFIVAEDTRQTSKILQKLNISKKLISLHEHTSRAKVDRLIDELKLGKSAAYLSDAGTPNLSDPGGKLAQAAYENKIKISPIPGPSALTALISVAPFNCSQFIFLGFFPKKKGREKLIGQIKKSVLPVFFFESPHRIRKTLALLKDRLPYAKILIGRELTKIYEEIIWQNLADLDIGKIREEGEFVVGLHLPK
jgi:16S rRNA (cytidine1402-2'-O)-methyltransferase